jgi:hypothetical protein
MLRLAFIALLTTSACHASPSLVEFERSPRSLEARDPAPDLEGQVSPAPTSPKTPAAPKTPSAPSGSSSRILDLDDLEGNVWAGLLGFSSDYHSDPKFTAGVLVRAPSPLLSRGLFGMKRDDLGIYLQAGAGSLDRDVSTPDDTRGSVLLGTLGVDYTIVRNETWMVLAQGGMQYVGVKDVASANDGVGFVVGGLGGFALTDRLWITFNPQFILGDGDYLYLLSVGLHYSF